MRAIGMVLALVACAEPQVEDYDATCGQPEDCAVVLDQAYCGYCDSWAALSIEGAAEFEADQERYTKHKNCTSYVLIGCTQMGDPPTATCDAGTCALQW